VRTEGKIGMDAALALANERQTELQAGKRIDARELAFALRTVRGGMRDEREEHRRALERAREDGRERDHVKRVARELGIELKGVA
jgi:hypothetical protein